MMPVIIRSFRKEDAQAVRDLCADTAFMGEPLEVFLDDRELFVDLAVIYYINYEPESIFLAESGGKVVGYILGSRNEAVYGRITSGKIFPCLVFKILKSFFFRPRARIFLFHILVSFARGEFRRPDFSKEYPAHLHINIAKGFRAQGIGTMLMDRFLSYLKEQGARAARLSSCSKKAFVFFEKCGFKLLHQQEIAYFDYPTGEDLFVRIYGKKL